MSHPPPAIRASTRATDSPVASRCHSAFALVEAALAIVIVSVLFVASLGAVGASRKAQAWNADRLRAAYLASDLMAEILDKAYATAAEGAFLGPAAGEVTGGRSAFNDVDDYNGYQESPPKDRAGVPLPGLGNWGRRVEVDWVSPSNLGLIMGAESGVKRITVTVSRSVAGGVGVPLERLVALRTVAGGR